MKHRLSLLAALLLLLLGGCSRNFYDRISLADIQTDGPADPTFAALSAAADDDDGVVMFRPGSDEEQGYLLVTTGREDRLRISGDEYNPRTREFTLRLTRFRPGVEGMLSSQQGDRLMLLRFPKASFSLLRVVIDAEGDADASKQSIYEFHKKGVDDERERPSRPLPAYSFNSLPVETLQHPS